MAPASNGAPFTCTGHLPAEAILSAVGILPSRLPTLSGKDPLPMLDRPGGSRVETLGFVIPKVDFWSLTFC